MTSRDDHLQAVGFAGLEIEQAGRAFGAAQEKLAQAIDAAYNAIGTNDTFNDAARNVMENLAQVRDLGDVIQNHLRVAIGEMTRYGNGF